MKRLFVFILFVGFAFAQPRIGNYFLDSYILNTDIDSLSRCDFLVLDHEVARQTPEVIDSIRAKNPLIKIIAYIVSQEISLNPDNGSLSQSMSQDIREEWWFRDSDGEYITFWPGTRMLNIGSGQPGVSALTWNRYLAGVINDSILSDPRWDGVYLDNCWHSISWKSSKIDVNSDGITDEKWMADSLWKSGMNVLLEQIREKYPDKIVVGNGGYQFGEYLNGALFEGFPKWGGWWQLMDIYRNLDSTAVENQFNLLNTMTDNSGIINLQKMRFGLTSTLMGEGYFSYDYGDKDHSQNWWFDEYDVDLGAPTEKATYSGAELIVSNDFESGYDSWVPGSWKMTTSLITASGGTSFFADVTGEEPWNALLYSPELSLEQGTVLKATMRVRVTESQKGAHLFTLLRKGDLYDEDINLSSFKIEPGVDTVISFYSDSTITGSGYKLMVGMKEGGKVLIDDIILESNSRLVMSRSYENGKVLVNGSPNDVTISVPGYSTFKGDQDTVHNSGKVVSAVTLKPKDGIILVNSKVGLHQKVTAPSLLTISLQEKVLRIESSSGSDKSVVIADLRGRRVYSEYFSSKAKEISLKDVAPGPYTVQLFENRKSVMVEKLVLH